jgi:preprotein translocase subunit SecE
VVSEDRTEQDAQDQADGGQSPSPRPATAAARRERRSAAAGAAGSDVSSDVDGKTDGSTAEDGKADAVKTDDGKADGGTGDGQGTRAASRPAGKRTEARRPETRRSDKSYDPRGRTTLSGRREERASLFSRLVRFLREVVAELRKVIWPTRKELVTYTIVVLFFVSFMVASVFVLDIAFAKGVFWLFG